MKYKKCFLLNVIYFFIGSSICFSFESDVAVQVFKPEHHFIKRAFYFPSDEQVTRGIYLKLPGPICIDNQDDIYIGDWNYCTFFKFDENGKHIRSFGKKGQGPGELQYALKIAAIPQGLVLLDNGNHRIQILDKNLDYKSSFKISKSYVSMAVSKEGLIYLGPRSPESQLLDVFNMQGQLVKSFGDKIKSRNSHPAFHDIFLGVNSKGGTWVAWKYFHYLSRFTRDGELLKKYVIEDDSIKEFVKMNEKLLNSSTHPNKGKLMRIINCFYLTDSRFYIFLIGKAKPRIVEYDYEAVPRRVYEILDNTEKEIVNNMVVIERGEDRIFYLVQGLPEARIDVYKIVD